MHTHNDFRSAVSANLMLQINFVEQSNSQMEFVSSEDKLYIHKVQIRERVV